MTAPFSRDDGTAADHAPESTDRRGFLRSMLAAGAIMSPAAALAAVPPMGGDDAELFELLAEAQRSWDAISVYSRLADTVLARQEGRKVDPESKSKLEEAHDNYTFIEEAVFEYVPQTIAGVRRKLAFVAKTADGIMLEEWMTNAIVSSLLASPVLT